MMVLTTAYHFRHRSRRTVAYISLPRITYACILYPSHYFYVLYRCFDRERRPPGAVLPKNARVHHDGSPRAPWNQKPHRKGISITTQLDANDSPQKASQSESRSVFGYSEGRAASLPPCLALACPAPCPVSALLCIDDEHVGKGILVYSHFSKRNRVHTCLLVPILCLCY
jgi:hypothetical protein